MALRTLKGRRLDVIFSVAYEGSRCECTLVSIVDISARKAAEADARRLASIVEHSEDAIYSIDLDGNITSWNRGAARLYGYVADEVIGRSVMLLMPQELHRKEHSIVERIKQGETIEPYETVRQCKDGRLIDVSLAVSPVRGADGELIGAAKIARDISERKRALEQQRLLVNEMKHRVKNTLATVRAIATQTFKEAPREECDRFAGRVQALAQAHDLLTREQWDRTPLDDVLTGALKPFLETNGAQFDIEGCQTPIEAKNALLLTMIIHELATNALKHGALANGHGQVGLSCGLDDGDGRRVKIVWRGIGQRLPSLRPDTEGIWISSNRRCAQECGRRWPH